VVAGFAEVVWLPLPTVFGGVWLVTGGVPGLAVLLCPGAADGFAAWPAFAPAPPVLMFVVWVPAEPDGSCSEEDSGVAGCDVAVVPCGELLVDDWLLALF